MESNEDGDFNISMGFLSIFWAKKSPTFSCKAGKKIGVIRFYASLFVAMFDYSIVNQHLFLSSSAFIFPAY